MKCRGSGNCRLGEARAYADCGATLGRAGGGTAGTKAILQPAVQRDGFSGDITRFVRCPLRSGQRNAERAAAVTRGAARGCQGRHP
jgi:hypothetical protein